MEKPPSVKQESMEKSPAQEPSQPSKSGTPVSQTPPTESKKSKTEQESSPQQECKAPTITTKQTTSSSKTTPTTAESDKTPEIGSRNSLPSTEQSSSRLPEKSSFLIQLAIIGTISAQFVGDGSVNYFPNMVLKHGGFWFLIAHILLTFLLGLPLVFFDLLIGQITRKGITAAYGTYCKAAKGLGIGFFLISMFFMSIRTLAYFDNAGFNTRLLISSITNEDHALTCDNLWNTKNCFSLYESLHSCNRTEDNKQLAYIDGNCTEITYKHNLVDAILEYSNHFSNNPTTEMDHYKLVAAMLILIVPLGLIFLDVKYTFYIFALIFCVYFLLYLVYMIMVTSINGDVGAAIDYIWHRTHYANFANLMSYDALVSGVLWNLSVHGVMTPIGSFLRPKDNAFRIALIPILICLTVAILSVLKTASALCSLQKYQPASGYLYHTMHTNTQGVLLYSQLLLSYTDSIGWLGLKSLFKLLGNIGQMSFEVLGWKAAFRDHLQGVENKRLWKIGILSFFVAFHTIVIVIYCLPEKDNEWKLYNKVSVSNFNKRLFYFMGLAYCIHIYGEVDFRIDLAKIYTEHENWRRFFSPVGPIMFICWKYVVPFIVMLNQSLVFVLALAKFRKWPRSILQPVFVAVVPLCWTVVVWLKHLRNGKSIRDAYMPSKDHPSYNRIMERQQMASMASKKSEK